MAGKKGQKKRFWADEEKRSICAQASAPGVSVAQVARRYAMNANLIFKWLKDPLFSPATSGTPVVQEGGSVFLPVEISGSALGQQIDDRPAGTAVSTSASLLAHRVDITLSDGRRVVVEGPTALSPRDRTDTIKLFRLQFIEQDRQGSKAISLAVGRVIAAQLLAQSVPCLARQ
ncbi:transposase [Citreimonas salinaria]|uniref:Transposase n=1 Tax=Citreimonas salinaria TaxID=321339 RepID=A0A1H3MXP8_9RHOB|nr:transposase [Citreimonas salinaria]SDY81487.1 Transposase [Citreimonas salinaria]